MAFRRKRKRSRKVKRKKVRFRRRSQSRTKSRKRTRSVRSTRMRRRSVSRTKTRKRKIGLSRLPKWSLKKKMEFHRNVDSTAKLATRNFAAVMWTVNTCGYIQLPGVRNPVALRRFMSAIAEKAAVRTFNGLDTRSSRPKIDNFYYCGSKMTTMLMNQTGWPCRFTAYLCSPRQDVPLADPDILSGLILDSINFGLGGSPPPVGSSIDDSLEMTPFWAPSFTRMYKVHKVVKGRIKAGMTKALPVIRDTKAKKFYYGQIAQDSLFLKYRGAKFWLIRGYGVYGNNVTNPASASLYTQQYEVNGDPPTSVVLTPDPGQFTQPTFMAVTGGTLGILSRSTYEFAVGAAPEEQRYCDFIDYKSNDPPTILDHGWKTYLPTGNPDSTAFGRVTDFTGVGPVYQWHGDEHHFFGGGSTAIDSTLAEDFECKGVTGHADIPSKFEWGGEMF